MADTPSLRARAGRVIGPWLRDVRPDRRTLKEDLLAGLPGAISSVPDGMASSVLVGTNPVYGLYASAVGPLVGGLFSSTRLMVITTTSAAALAAGSSISGLDPADRPAAIFLLTFVAGVLMMLAGFFKLGRYTRFVSHSVMIGFLTGVGVNIIFSQIPDLLGVPSMGSFPAAKAWNAIMDIGNANLATILTGAGALAIIVILDRTRLRLVGAVIALIIPTLLVIIAGADEVARVSDQGEIPFGIPFPALPHLSAISLDVLAGAFAVAAIVLVQGSGVAQSAPNRDGTRSSMNRDFIAEGAANLASGMFNGIPVGGSVGQTALNVSAGGKGRWAAIFSGLWMLVILFALSGVVGAVAMPTLAAVLVYAAYGSLRVQQIKTVLRTGRISQVAIITTFVATLLLPVALAVGIGVALSLLLQLNRDALDLVVTQVSRDSDGRRIESPPPTHLASDTITVLFIYGSLFYAGARTLQVRLPDPAGSSGAAVVLRLRGRTTLGATVFAVFSDYARRLEANGGRLYLSGLDPDALLALERTHLVSADGPIFGFVASEVIGESSQAAIDDATAWQIRHRDDPEGGATISD